MSIHMKCQALISLKKKITTTKKQQKKQNNKKQNFKVSFSVDAINAFRINLFKTTNP